MTKLCSKCKEEKDLEFFHKDKTKKSGLVCCCKSCKKIATKKYYSNNTKKCILKSSKWKKENRKQNSIHSKKWAKNNRQHINSYVQDKANKNINFKLAGNLRSRLSEALKKGYKSGSAVKDLGCTINQLKDWLERQFMSGMTWENYGNKEGQWSIDHAYPLSLVDLTKKELLLPVVHYTNLQPLWNIDNVRKSNEVGL